MIRSPFRTRNSATCCVMFHLSTNVPSCTPVMVKPPCEVGAMPRPSFSPPPRRSCTASTGEICRTTSSSVSRAARRPQQQQQQQHCLQTTPRTIREHKTTPASIVLSSVSILWKEPSAFVMSWSTPDCSLFTICFIFLKAAVYDSSGGSSLGAIACGKGGNATDVGSSLPSTASLIQAVSSSAPPPAFPGGAMSKASGPCLMARRTGSPTD
mmetsp:Transcript_103625/g.275680  ORF Transcript_103625/g.275680 Transcript_103625/m.275680 type:complete len:211 (+) Transcript_103625:788-1420(+)